MHRIDGASPFDRQLQVAELEYVTTSRPAAVAMAENYVGVAAV
jgi:p-hydroxybenzoate 3-monooxygenase